MQDTTNRNSYLNIICIKLVTRVKKVESSLYNQSAVHTGLFVGDKSDLQIGPSDVLVDKNFRRRHDSEAKNVGRHFFCLCNMLATKIWPIRIYLLLNGELSRISRQVGPSAPLHGMGDKI